MIQNSHSEVTTNKLTSFVPLFFRKEAHYATFLK